MLRGGCLTYLVEVFTYSSVSLETLRGEFLTYFVEVFTYSSVSLERLEVKGMPIF